ncbi:MAG: hypothetical protein IJ012_07555 [Clostridia bacterium]|nr:hypothetical protein [Clostridia bacterium]
MAEIHLKNPDEQLTLEQHRARIENLRRADADIHSCVREWRIYNYLPGQVIYYLGDYPAPMSISPTEYDKELLKSYAENGVDFIQVHEEWNDTIEKYGSTKYMSCDHEGMLKFVDACHDVGIKIIPYCSASYMHQFNKAFTPNFLRTPDWPHGSCVDMHYSYRTCSAGSAHWREFIIPRTFNIMDTYGFDGIFNDWGYDWDNSPYRDIPADKRNYEMEPLERYDPEAEDLVHTLYEGVHRRGGIYKVHIFNSNRAPVRGKYYDYLWVGEGEFKKNYGAGKMFEPYLVPCPDKPRLTNWFAEKFDMDAYFAMCIPFVQFPLLTHGRPTLGKCIDVPGVEQYHTVEPTRLYSYFKKVREYSEAHPNGPFTYSEWSQIPDDVEDYPRWCRYLALYKPMVKDGTVVHMELRDTDAILSDIPADVYATLFTNHEEYMVVSNLTDAPYTLITRDKWENRETHLTADRFTIPSKRMVFLRRVADGQAK